jgi:hypothetical protein
MAGPRQSRNEFRGRYFNYASWYSVRLPKGLVGYDGRDQSHHNGFAIGIGKSPQSVVFVSGDPNSVEYKSPREKAVAFREFLQQEGKKIESETISNSRLGPLKAARLVVVYTCPGSTERRMYSSITALRNDKSVLYEISLYSRANRYESDRAVMDQLIESWKTLSKTAQNNRKPPK